jgi:hypothetical protein
MLLDGHIPLRQEPKIVVLVYGSFYLSRREVQLTGILLDLVVKDLEQEQC